LPRIRATAKAAISNELAKAFKDIQCLHARLYMTEHIVADEA
jgi:hypothetical protein